MTLTTTGRSTATLTDGRGFALRHVRPGAGEGAATVTLLGRSYGFEWLPTSTLPTSPDLVEGSYTRRINDAGEFELSFPNTASSKGHWREKFSEAGALEFIEIYRDGVLEFVGSIERVQIDRGVVTISGPDSWGLLRRAYERDRTWWDAPSTVIDAYTRVPVPAPGSNMTRLSGFDVGSPSIDSAGNYGWPLASSEPVGIAAAPRAMSGTAWRVEAVLPIQSGEDWDGVPFAPPGVGDTIQWLMIDAGNNLVGVSINDRRALLTSTIASVTASTPGIPIGHMSPELPAALMIERQGRWVRASIAGRGIGEIAVDGIGDIANEWFHYSHSGVDKTLARFVPRSTAVVSTALLRRGTERGDVVLPGDLPIGGLAGRYHNDADLQGLSTDSRKALVLAPNREAYGERLDRVVNFIGAPLPLQPGAGSDWFSVRWTGGVYLPLAGGQVEFRLSNVDNGARLWVGRTGAGEELLNRWGGTVGTIGPATTALGSADGWYPLRLEFREDAADAIISLQFRRTPGWTDPGGTVIASNTWTTVPATSLSPLGCHEARIQGQSHFEIVKDAAAQAGYELLCEPMSLESGEFPGRLVPRIRVGRDTDLVLEVEDRDDAEPILSPAVTRDSSDQAVRFIGSGAGNADGQGSQVLAEVVDLNADTLFELQAFADAGDASIPQLLEARLNAELALRATPWEEVRGTPRGMERLADTWPLSGTLSAMRWRPGDGIRISVPDIGVRDIEPRRITQVTRSFAAEGRTQTTVGFRQRPRGAAVALRRLARSVSLAQRSDQGRILTLTSAYISSSVAASGTTAFAVVPLLPGDQVLRAECRLVRDTGTGALTLTINTVDRTAALGGGWSTQPVSIDVTAYATQFSTTDNRLFALFTRPGGGTTGTIEFQLVLTVVRR